MDRNAEKHLDEPQTSKTAFDWDWFEALMKEDEPEDSPIGTEQSLRTEDEPEAPPVEAGQSIRTPEKKTVRERRTRRRLSVFSKFLMIYSGVFLLLIAVGLVFFWKYIAAYEASRPERTMDALTATVGGNAAALNEYFQVTAFENKDSVFDNIYSKAVEGQSCSYRKMIGTYTDDAPAYVFRAGSTDLFQIVLRPKA